MAKVTNNGMEKEDKRLRPIKAWEKANGAFCSFCGMHKGENVRKRSHKVSKEKK